MSVAKVPALEATPCNPALACAICSFVIVHVIGVDGFLEGSSAERRLRNGEESGFGRKEGCCKTLGHYEA